MAADSDPDNTETAAPVAADGDTVVARPGTAPRPRTHRSAESATAEDDADYPTLSVVDGIHYTDVRELARGGIGRISSARDRRLGRRVAIKELIRPSEWTMARFEREARITARLQHPNIIHVYESGRWPSGEPFYAMNLVSGRPLGELIDEAKTTSGRLALVANMVAVIDALAYAHSQHVIHRDLKPSNVIVGAFGETVVIDWGLAKDLSAPEVDPTSSELEPATSTLQTVEGTVLGTPAYMAPEQAAGKPLGATADVYALGAMLYQVLAGTPPFSARDRAQLLQKVANESPRPLAQVIPNAPPDLVAIVEKAMARDPAARFPTAKDMADEVKRFQTGQLVTSYRYSTRELVRRWMHRHRGALAVAALAAAVLIVLGVFSLSRVIGAERAARAALAKAESRADQVTLAQARAALDTDPSATLSWLAQLGHDRAVWREARAIAADAASRGIAHVLRGGTGDIRGLAFAADGRHLASGGDDRVVRVWDLTTWTARSLGRTAAGVVAVTFDGSEVLAVDARGAITRCATECTAVAAVAVSPRTAVFAPGGRSAILFGDSAVLWDAASSAPRSLGDYRHGAWSPDGARVVLATGSAIDRLEIASGEITTLAVMKPGEPAITAVATDGTRTWTTWLGDRRIFEIIDGRFVEQHSEHHGPVTYVAARDGAIVSASSDQELRDGRTRSFEAGDRSIVVWHRYRDFERLVGHDGNIVAVAAAQSGDTIASGGSDGTIRVWRVAGPGRLSDESYRPAVVAALADHGKTVVTGRPGWPAGTRPSFDIVDLASGRARSLACCDPEPAAPPAAAAITVTRLLAAPESRQFAALESDGVVTVWSLDRERGRRLADSVTAAAITRDGATVVVAGADGAIRAIDVATATSRTVGSVPAPVTAIACTATAARIAVGAADGVHVFGATARVIDGPVERIGALELSADGLQLAAAGESDLYVWDLTTGARRTWGGHEAAIEVLAFSPDGTRIASGSIDKTVRVWRDGKATVLRGHDGRITTLAFAGDGRELISAGDDRVARLWDVESGSGRALRGHQAFVLAAGIAADQRIVSVDADGAVRFHRDDLPRDEAGLRAWLASATNLTLDVPRPPPDVAPDPVGCAPGAVEERGRCRDVAAALDGLRWQLPCQSRHLADSCFSALPRTSHTVTLGGDPSTTYEVTLWFRGVVEQATYAAGSADGLWQVGGRPEGHTFNIYELRTSSPEQVYFLNAGKAGLRFVTEVNYQQTIRVTGGSTVTLQSDAQDTRQIANQDEHGKPLIVEGVAPAPTAFDGQFIQMNVVSVQPVR